jgi:hypothetical protein
MFCVMVAFALEWRGRELSGVRFNHVIGRNVDGYFQRPTGDLASRSPITKHQAETYWRYKRYTQWSGSTGMIFLVMLVVVALLRRVPKQSSDANAEVVAENPERITQ